MEGMTVLKRSSEHEGGGWVVAANHIIPVILTIVIRIIFIVSVLA